jgi:putative thioredoxin
MIDSSHSVSTNVVNFDHEVLERSHQQPVLVDFWAAWCQPCTILAPILEKLAKEAGDSWHLAKVNVDEHRSLMDRYPIKGIPAVYLIYQGETLAHFTGVRPEHELRRWLAEHLPDRRNLEHLTAAQEALLEGRTTDALNSLQNHLAIYPDDRSARLTLAKLLFERNRTEALALISDFREDDPDYDRAHALRTLNELIEDGTADLPEGTGKAIYLQAVAALAAHDYDGAMQAFLDLLLKDKTYRNKAARRGGVALFHYFGPEHPFTRKYRRTFDMYLD